MRIRALTVLVLVAAAVVAPASAAYAQCGSAGAVQDRLASAEVAFVGRVVDRSNRDRTAVMQVLEVWKGERLPSQVTVNGGPEDLSQQTAVDRTFLLSQIYLVMPANARPPFRDSLCSGTQLWSTPTGSIPLFLQDAVGTDVPIPMIPDGGFTADDGGVAGSLGTVGVALVVIVLALGLIFGVRRLGSLSRRGSRKTKRAHHGSTGPLPGAAYRSKKRRMGRLPMSGKLQSRRGSGLDRVRRAARRGRKAPDEHETQQLQRALKRTATRPPSRRNHYKSGRRR